MPTYFAEEHGLQTVEDLLSDEHWELFVGVATDLPPAPDERGRLVTCREVWRCARINEAKMAAYGLDDKIQLVTPETQGEPFGSLSGA